MLVRGIIPPNCSTPMQIRTRLGCEFASALCYRWPLLRTSDARPYIRIRTPVINPCRGGHRPSAEQSSNYGRRRCKFVKPNRVRICIGVVLSLAPTADEQCSPLHTEELFRNSYTFFSESICHLTIIRHPLHKPKQNEKTLTFRAAGNPKGSRPFWSF